MSRETWELAKRHKNFNVQIYRRGLMAVICSLGLSCVIVLVAFYKYVDMPEPDYYATNGARPPIMLNALLAPNSSSTAILPPDPPTDDVVKVIPQ